MSIPSGKRFINDQVRSTQVMDEENSCGFNMFQLLWKFLHQFAKIFHQFRAAMKIRHMKHHETTKPSPFGRTSSFISFVPRPLHSISLRSFTQLKDCLKRPVRRKKRSVAGTVQVLMYEEFSPSKKSIIPYFPGIIVTPPCFFDGKKKNRPSIRGPKVRLGKITSPISPTWSLCGWSCTREKASDVSAMSCCEQTR